MHNKKMKKTIKMSIKEGKTKPEVKQFLFELSHTFFRSAGG